MNSINESDVVEKSSGGAQCLLGDRILLDPPVQIQKRVRKYFDLNDWSKDKPNVNSGTEKSTNNHLSCLYTNATSLNNKYEELIVEIIKSDAQIVFVCETWWTDTSVTNIPGYSLFRKDRNSGRGGGVCIYTHNDLKSFVVNEKCLINDRAEQIWAIIEVGIETILCGRIYRTGNSEQITCMEITKSFETAHRLVKSNNPSSQKNVEHSSFRILAYTDVQYCIIIMMQYSTFLYAI